MSQDIPLVGPNLHLVTAEADQESPSLSAAGRDLAAYELKFLLSGVQAEEIEERVRGRMVLDRHADLSSGYGYHTTSLYFDTVGLDVFHRTPGFKRRKHRLRRYGQGPGVFLERKSKAEDKVRKRRTLVSVEEISRLAQPDTEESWSGHWFHQQLQKRGLQPVCRIAYDRVALVGRSADGLLRLTMDRNIRGALTDTWELGPVENGLPVLSGEVVCEFKYLGFLPMLFKDIIHAMQLTPRSVSKYRTFLRASGRVADRSVPDA